MFSIHVDLLTGRYCATRHNDRTAVEWPPHPQRLFSAMVAAWADADAPDDDEEHALLWFETIGSPDITCSEAWERRPVISYVPVNDAAVAKDLATGYGRHMSALLALDKAIASADTKAIAKAERAVAAVTAKLRSDSAAAAAVRPGESDKTAATALQVLPDRRNRQARVFPVAIPDDPHIRYSWPAACPPTRVAGVLDDLLARVHRIGHSSTFVSCRITTDAPTDAATLVPRSDGEESLRVPGPGLLLELRRAYEASNNGTEPRVLPSRAATYGRPHPTTNLRPCSVLSGDWIVLEDLDGRCLPVHRSVEMSTAVRDALMAHAQDPPSELISGHEPIRPTAAPTRPPAFDTTRTPPLQRPHLAILPLPFVGTTHADASIFGVALAIPAGTADEQRRQLVDALDHWLRDNPDRRHMKLTLRGGRVVRLRQVGGDGPTTLRSSTWCRPSGTWATVTPIALDRHPGNIRDRNPRRRSRALSEAEATIASACSHLGLPEPIEVAVDLDPFVTASPPVRAYPPFRSGSGPVRALVHARISFGELIDGPVVLGAGRYRGLGLCAPVPSRTGLLR